MLDTILELHPEFKHLKTIVLDIFYNHINDQNYVRDSSYINYFNSIYNTIILVYTKCNAVVEKTIDKYGNEKKIYHYASISNDEFYCIDTSRKALKFLKSEGIIYSDEIYIIGEKCKGYKLDTSIFDFDNIKTLKTNIISNKITDLININKNMDKYINNKTLNTIIENLNGFSEYTKNKIKTCNTDLIRIFDVEKACNIIQNNSELDELEKLGYLQILERMLKHNYWVSNNNTCRLYSVFNSLPKILRACFIDFTESDISNSQPLAISGMYDNKNISYLNACETGQFYEILAEKTNLTREQVKELTPHIYNGTNKKAYKFIDGKYDQYKNLNSVKKAFIELWPDVYDFINTEVKTNNRSTASIKYQSLESKVMIYNVYPKLLELGITCFTIHDSIATNKIHKDIVTKIIDEEWFKVFHNHPKIK